MRHAVKHGMTEVDKIRAALDRLYAANVDRFAPYSPRLVWNGDRSATVSLVVMTRTVIADFVITDDEILIDGKFPFVFGHLEGRILRSIGDHLEKSFAAARADRAGPTMPARPSDSS
jgi:hypothetical protein